KELSRIPAIPLLTSGLADRTKKYIYLGATLPLELGIEFLSPRCRMLPPLAAVFPISPVPRSNSMRLRSTLSFLTFVIFLTALVATASDNHQPKNAEKMSSSGQLAAKVRAALTAAGVKTFASAKAATAAASCVNVP